MVLMPLCLHSAMTCMAPAIAPCRLLKGAHAEELLRLKWLPD